MFLVSLPLKEFLIILIILLIIGLTIFICLYQNKKRKVFKSRVIYKLMKAKMENVELSKNKIYDLSFSFNNKIFYMKLYRGGNKKGFVMTNPTTIYEQIYRTNFSPAKKNYRLEKLTSFLVEPLEGIKVILIQDNLLRINKYINENEIEEVKFNERAFSTYLVQEKDFDNFIETVKRNKK